MSKLTDFLKKIPNTYYKWKKRNDDLEKFLLTTNENSTKLSNIGATMNTLSSSIKDLHTNLDQTHADIDQITAQLETIKRGTKMELFDTLHNWRVILVNRGWASMQEKKEVESIWHVYHEELNGNGQGQHYYDEIMALPESPEEMEVKKNV